MIVCISGPSSTGKSTLISELSKHKDLIESITDNKCEFHTETIRIFISKNYPNQKLEDIISSDESAIRFQTMLADLDYTNYSEMIKQYNIIHICDRSPLDTLIYNLINYHCDNTEVMRKMADELSIACTKLRSIYTYVNRVYYCSPDRENNYGVEDDGFRPSKYVHRRQLEIELFNSIFYNDNKMIQLPSLTNDRVRMILSDLKELI